MTAPTRKPAAAHIRLIGERLDALRRAVKVAQDDSPVGPLKIDFARMLDQLDEVTDTLVDAQEIAESPR